MKEIIHDPALMFLFGVMLGGFFVLLVVVFEDWCKRRRAAKSLQERVDNRCGMERGKWSCTNEKGHTGRHGDIGFTEWSDLETIQYNTFDEVWERNHPECKS